MALRGYGNSRLRLLDKPLAGPKSAFWQRLQALPKAEFRLPTYLCSQYCFKIF